MASMGRNIPCRPFLKAIALHKAKLFITFLTCCLFVVFSISYIPLRNILFPFALTAAWRDVDTIDLIRMRATSAHIPEDFKIPFTCDTTIKFNDTFERSRLDPDKIIKYNNVTIGQTLEMLSRGLGRYLVAMNLDQKMSALRLYLNLAQALEKHKVPFFLVDGSLLGVVRHGGFIPWDDDIDIGVDVMHSKQIRKALSCINGTDLYQAKTFHWKFRYQGNWFPFIDLFIYDKDDRYLWALTRQFTRTLVYNRQNVFPLSTAQFEGSVTVPIPGKALQVAKRIYTLDCMAEDPHRKVNRTWLAQFPNGYSKSRVPCQALAQFYKVVDLDG